MLRRWDDFDDTYAFCSIRFADRPQGLSRHRSIDVTHDVFTLSGERRADAPEGYAPQRVERGLRRFSRSCSLPARVDLERASAAIENGGLTVTLPKAPEARPRPIAVRGG